MPLANPYQRYQSTAVKTADRGDLLLLTYEALLRWLARADEAIDGGKPVEAHQALIACQDLVRNLAAGLNYEQGGDVAERLGALYDYFHRQLMEANALKDKALIASVRQLVSPLLDAWRVAVPTARKQGHLQGV
ncbi:MAG TPA: flagellar export chaperone FliS [Chloroflexota bacterium]